MTKSEQTPENIWIKLSPGSRLLAFNLAIYEELPTLKEELKHVSSQPRTRFVLDKAISELESFGVLEKITKIDEMRERLAKMRVPQGDWRNRPMLDESERKYLELVSGIERYEAQRHTQPERYELWDEPGYRLEPNFLGYVNQVKQSSKD